MPSLIHDKRVLLLLLFGAFLAAHPYAGLGHDAKNYAMQAMAMRSEGQFAGEVYLTAGDGQGMSIFLPIFGALIAKFGPSLGALIAAGVGKLVWFAGAVAFIRSALARQSTTVQLASLLLLVASYGQYGSENVLHVAEPFATPRIFAEGLGLAALGAVIAGRSFLGIGLIALAGLFHPVMALAPAAGCWLLMVGRDRRWLWLGAAGAVLLGAALWSGIPPFDAFYGTIDGEWEQLTRWRNGYLYPSQFDGSAYAPLVSALSLFLLARHLDARAVKPAGVLLAVAIGGLALAVIAEITGNALLIQLQFWRALWLLVLVPPLLAPMIIAGIVGGNYSRDMRLGLVGGVSILLLLAFHWWDGVIIGIAVFLILMGLQAGCSGRVWTVAPKVLVVLAVFVLGSQLFIAAAASDQMKLSFAMSLFIAPVAAVLLVYGRSRLALSILALTGLGGLVFFDQRMPEEALYQAPGKPYHPLIAALPVDGEIYWDGQSAMVWFGAGRNVYLSAMHGAPMAFERTYAHEYRKRFANIGDTLGADVSTSNWRTEAPWRIDPARFARHFPALCRKAPALGVVVSSEKVEGLVGRIALPQTPYLKSRYFAYPCAPHRTQQSG